MLHKHSTLHGLWKCAPLALQTIKIHFIIYKNMLCGQKLICFCQQTLWFFFCLQAIGSKLSQSHNWGQWTGTGKNCMHAALANQCFWNQSHQSKTWIINHFCKNCIVWTKRIAFFINGDGFGQSKAATRTLFFLHDEGFGLIKIVMDRNLIVFLKVDRVDWLLAGLEKSPNLLTAGSPGESTVNRDWYKYNLVPNVPWCRYYCTIVPYPHHIHTTHLVFCAYLSNWLAKAFVHFGHKYGRNIFMNFKDSL